MYAVVAFYKIIDVENPHGEVAKWSNFLEGIDVTARIYLSEQGINCQLSVAKGDMSDLVDWVRKDPLFGDVDMKVQMHHEHVFPRLTVKYREQLCALDAKVDFSKQATHVSPEEWDAMLEEGDENTVVLDVRNDYEWDVGHFKGAKRPSAESFRDFPQYLERLKEELDVETTRVLMCCTGGIRCEFFSPLMKEAGFKQLYQLEGGIIKYGIERGQNHWEGDLFVFDDRLVVPIGKEKHEAIGKCHMCERQCDTFYNCANMDCNELFMSCLSCAEEMKGCCCEACQDGRCREFVPRDRPKPFRRLSQQNHG